MFIWGSRLTGPSLGSGMERFKAQCRGGAGGFQGLYIGGFEDRISQGPCRGGWDIPGTIGKWGEVGGGGAEG